MRRILLSLVLLLALALPAQAQRSGGTFQTYNITSNAVVTTGVTRLVRVVVVVSAAAASAVYDTNATASVGAGNEILAIPASTTAGTVYYLDWPCNTGIVVEPGSGVTLAISWGP